MRTLGQPRVHFRLTDSTNARARELAGRGVPHGTVVTAAEQSAGRGRQGRTWSAPRGRALLCSVVIREPPRLLPLAAGVAVAEVVGALGADRTARGALGANRTARGALGADRTARQARIKWPNDILVDGRKVAGILVEGRPQEGWSVVGIGVNVALRVPEDLPAELRDTGGTLGLAPDAVEPVLDALLEGLEVWIWASDAALLAAVRARDALRGRPVRWAGGSGVGAGVDSEGRLLVATDAGTVALEAGEVHLVA